MKENYYDNMHRKFQVRSINSFVECLLSFLLTLLHGSKKQSGTKNR